MSNETHFQCGDGAQKEPFEYRGCGIDGVWLGNGYTVEDTAYGLALHITNIKGLHKAIGIYLITNKKVLAPTELRFLRKQMDLTQAELGRWVSLSDQQVARWEKGSCGISGAADSLLRLLYLGKVVGQVDPVQFLEELEGTDSVCEDKIVLDETEGEWHAREAA